MRSRGGSGRPAVPATINGAFWINVGLMVLAVVNVPLSLNNDVWDEIAAVGADLKTPVPTAASTSTVVSTVVAVVLYLWLAIMMRKGKGWARIMLAGLIGLSILMDFTTATEVTVNGRVFDTSIGWIRLVGLALGVAAVVLMFLKPSNDYVARVSASRSR